MSLIQTYKVSSNQKACSSHKINPLQELLQVLTNQESSLKISSISLPLVNVNQHPLDFLAISAVLHQAPPFLLELVIQNQNIGAESLIQLSVGISNHRYLKKLELSSSHIQVN